MKKTPTKLSKWSFEAIWRPRTSNRGGLLDIYYRLDDHERAEVLESSGLVKHLDFLSSLNFESYAEAENWFDSASGSEIRLSSGPAHAT